MPLTGVNSIHVQPEKLGDFEKEIVERARRAANAVTRIRGRPRHTEALEELIRKLSEAIAKVADTAHLASFQNYFGDLSEYWVVRPLTELGELDTQLVGATLLEKAFGPGEGGLLWRAGTEAVESAHRELLSYRPEMSNPGSCGAGLSGRRARTRSGTRERSVFALRAGLAPGNDRARLRRPAARPWPPRGSRC